jgi:3',5'-cyclic AMP phosphodiesterase CpdA
MPAVRLAHLSDVHVWARCRWRLGDFFSKRVTSWLNFRLHRREHFRDAEARLADFRAWLTAHPVDLVVFSGDATTLGFEPEVARAAALLGVGERPGLAVPGNHDYLVGAAARSGAFERHFAPWLEGERPGPTYPFARRAAGLWLVGVCSAVPNHLPHDARGRVGPEQLARLEALLARLDGTVVLVTHYPVARADCSPQDSYHGLRDLDDLIAVAARGRVALWLHGHDHNAYRLPPGPGRPFPVICSGSATQRGLASFGEYTIEGGRLTGARWVAGPSGASEAERFEMELGGAGR